MTGGVVAVPSLMVPVVPVRFGDGGEDWLRVCVYPAPSVL
jgi:hypothetical protein